MNLQKDNKVGKYFWFEYHCYESDDSCDEEIWYRSHQKVKILSVSEWSFDNLQDRIDDGQPRVYKVMFNDGLKYDVYEDELMNSTEDFYRLNPPIKNLQENIRRILREVNRLNPTKRVYDYDPVRDTVPERLPFDIDKLVDSGVVFVTPAIDGDPKSETYKEWTEEPHTHLISLYNVEHSSEDGWIKKAITKGASTEQYKNFVNKIYDGKYNQILWSLEKLGINPMDMLIDMNIQENIRRILKEELLREGNIEIPQSEINKAGILLDLIKSKIDIYRENTMTYYSPMVDFKNYFKLLDKEGNPNYVSVGIYNDGNDFAPARMDVNKNTLLVNVNSWGDDVDIPLDYFEDTITHELVHSMDPLLKNDDRYKNYYEKKGAEPTGSKINLSKSPNSKSEYDRNYNKYAKSQHEYTAELTPLINKIRRVVKGDGTKIKWMFWVISNISKFNDVEDLFLRTEQYFKDGDNPLFKTTDDYWYYLFDIFNIIKPWTVKPTLYKKLINDIYLGITK